MMRLERITRMCYRTDTGLKQQISTCESLLSTSCRRHMAAVCNKQQTRRLLPALHEKRKCVSEIRFLNIRDYISDTLFLMLLFIEKKKTLVSTLQIFIHAIKTKKLRESI